MIVWIVGSFGWFGVVQAQECNPRNTGNNAVIVFPSDMNVRLLRTGDIISAHYKGQCVGSTSYESGQSSYLTVWGNDSLTVDLDGILPGKVISYKVYRPSKQKSIDLNYVRYEGQGIGGFGGRYNPDVTLTVRAIGFLTGGPPALFPPQPLLEVVVFSASLDGATAVLGWETATETNNAGFDIELLGADSTFRSLTFVAGAGTTQTPHHYRYRVPELAPGMHRFRLKQRDHDGRFAYSETVEVVVPVPSSYYLTEAYPNPFNPEARLLMTLRSSELVEAGLYDLQGRLVRVLHRGEVPAGVPFPIEVVGGGLSSGVYLVRVQGASFVTTRTLTLLK